MLKYKHKKNITLIYQECFLKNYLSNDIVIEYIIWRIFFVQSSPKWKLYIVSIKEYFFYANVMLRIRGYSFMKGIICVLPKR